ncbi:hypothetical protein ACVDFE_08060 [Lentzea chajnantorensis]
MAGGGAVALLLRAAALGGFTAAAWLMGGSPASADANPVEAPPAVEITTEAPAPLDPATPVTAPQPVQEQSPETAAPTAPLAEQATETLAATPAGEPQPLDRPQALDEPQAADEPQALDASQLFTAPSLSDDPAGWATAFTTSFIEQHQPVDDVPVPGFVPPNRPEDPAGDDDHDDGPVLDFTGGTHSNSRSGTVSNKAPPEVIRAKAQVRAARLAARAAAELPAPPPPTAAPVAVAVAKYVPQPLRTFSQPTPQAEPAPQQADLTWTEPGRDAPAPAPQPAPVTTTASASSSHTDNSGGTRGVLAVLTSRNELFPPATWSVEERRDGRSPGSLPGLPSTSPD